MALFDVHAHLTHPRLSPHLPEVLARARAAGLGTIISNGLNPNDNEAVRRLAADDPLVKPAYGFYPVDAVLPALLASGKDYPRDGAVFTADEGVAWVREHAAEALAVGEIGLDGHWVPEALWEAQEAVFRRLVAVAMDFAKPIIIHTRKREKRALEILREMGPKKVVWHCFGGKVSLARTIADEPGHYLSIPANARRSESFTRMLETLPKDRVLLETDCPYLGPDREATNEPANVALTAAFAAELWGTSIDDVTARMAGTFEAVFGVAP